MKRIRPILLGLLLIISILVITGCNDKRTKISSILNKPDKYISKEVIIAGKVDNVYSVNLFIAEAGAYQLDDGSGKIWVITKNGVPSEGTEVGLTGEVSQGVKLMGETFGVVVREKERRTR
ncbi:MAG: hypothetical protein ACYC27_05780 [Armatimonadota bacterium]